MNEVLIVSTSDSDRRLMSGLLTRAGYEPISAKDMEAAKDAAKVRLQPILMTVLSMAFGLVPLMTAHGVDANGSRSLATGVIGGMIVGTLALLFLVPSLFITFQWLQERTIRKRDKTEPQEWRWSMNEDFE